METETSPHAASVIGWLAAALASAWAWIIRVGVIGRIDKVEQQLEEKVDESACAARQRTDAGEHVRIDAGHNALNNKIDALSAELRKEINETRREIKTDLGTIIDLVRAQK